MSLFMQVTREAPQDANIVYYRALGDSYTVIQRRSDGSNDVIANASREAVSLIIGGASSRKLSVFDWDSSRFDCGTVEQMMRPWGVPTSGQEA